jgi:cytochrome c5
MEDMMNCVARLLCPLLCSVIVIGCTAREPSGGPATAADTVPPSESERATTYSLPSAADRRETGRLAYERVCAPCHDTGPDGAPVKGVEQDWSDRSDLWQAVLIEHVEQGYLKMPARGGDTLLEDAEVAAAAEYMLGITYPELPGD